MASSGNVEAMLNGVSDGETARILKAVFKYVLRNLRMGRATTSVAGQPAAAENFSGGFFSATTPAIANTEFVIVHRFGRPPYLLQPVLPLDQVSAAIVRLTVSRAADIDNVYLKSPDTEQPIFVYLEG
jgi:hypothetical protein